MHIRITKTPRSYAAHHDDTLIAELIYSRDGDRFVAIQTTVDPAAEGKGIGSILAASLLEDARTERVKVVAQCPFVDSYIDKHPEYADLRATT